MMEGEILDRRYWEHRAAGELPGEDEVGAGERRHWWVRATALRSD